MGINLDRLGEENINTHGSKIIVSRYKNSSDVDVYFPEYNWTFKNTTYSNFKRGTIKCPYEPRVYGVGYLGEGEYRISRNNKVLNCSQIWISMLSRCYGKRYLVRQPSYKNCTVCEEWHNFQNFAKWFDDNYYKVDDERMCLDKDIINKGNKTYSPKNCVFVPQSINNLFVKREASRGEYPIGVSYNKTNGKFQARCNNAYKKGVELGDYDNQIDAFNEYKRFKELTIKKVADLYKDLIPKKLYDAMYKYEVEITD